MLVWCIGSLANGEAAPWYLASGALVAVVGPPGCAGAPAVWAIARLDAKSMAVESTAVSGVSLFFLGCVVIVFFRVAGAACGRYARGWPLKIVPGPAII